MSSLKYLIVVAFSVLAAPLHAQSGEALFQRCAACHSVIGPGGQVIVQGGRVGPNLYGVAGRRAGGQRGFNYSRSMMDARAAGLVWTEAHFVRYLRNPNEFLQDWLGDKRARARMAFRLDRGGAEVYRYLQSLER